MEFKDKVLAGTVESSDCMILLLPSDKLEIVIDSVVKKQFGKRIEAIILDKLREFNVSKGIVKINDQGALDFVIEARLETALRRMERSVGK